MAPFKNARPPALTLLRARGFTLVELLLSMSVLAIIMVVSATVISGTQRVWTQGSKRTEQFREARVAFETITQNLRQTTLNVYTTYKYANGKTIPTLATDAPTSYLRNSELQFITGQSTVLLGGTAQTTPMHCVFFQAPLGVSFRDNYEGLTDLICGRGYFVARGDDVGWRPSFVSTPRVRYRLMEYRPPSETNRVYTDLPGQWFSQALNQGVTAAENIDNPAYTRPVAENIIGLIISPRVAKENLVAASTNPAWIAPKYAYDSTVDANKTGTSDPQGTQHLLPPIVRVTLVAIDEASARKFADEYPNNPPDLVPDNIFVNESNYEADLATLEANLASYRLTYRVFNAAVALRNAKWKIL